MQSHDQGKSKLFSTIIANSGAHAFIDEKITKSMPNKNNLATIKNKSSSNKDLVTIACRAITRATCHGVNVMFLFMNG